MIEIPTARTRAPVLHNIVRQHAEMAAFLWTVYDHHLLHPDENPDMDEDRVARLIARLEAHLDGLRVAGEAGVKIAGEQYAEYPEQGQLFVVRMLQPEGRNLRVIDLDPTRVRSFITANLNGDARSSSAKPIRG